MSTAWAWRSWRASRTTPGSGSSCRTAPGRSEASAPEGVQPGALVAQPGAVGAVVADQGLHMGPEARAVVQLPQVGALVGGDVVGHLPGRERQAPGVADRRRAAAHARPARAPAAAGVGHAN